jgi:hypothetical protein
MRVSRVNRGLRVVGLRVERFGCELKGFRYMA